MGGMCGVIHSDRRATVHRPAVEAMARAMQFAEREHQEVICQDATGLAIVCANGAGSFAETARNGRPFYAAVYGDVYQATDHGRAAGQAVAHAVLQQYLKEGLSFIDRLRGDFAIAVWDGREEALHVVTDRFRVHPIFYHADRDQLVFASRMKGLLAGSLLGRGSVRMSALVDIMAFSAVTSPGTVFDHVDKLPPGHVLTYRDGEARVSAYWNVDFTRPSRARRSELAAQLKQSLTDAVAVRLSSDTDRRIGSFLSGGIDSSTVTGLLTRLGKAPVKAFSIGFAEQRFNEMEFARIAARHFHAEHHEYYVTPEDTVDAIPIVLDSFDEPFANASAIPTYFCAKLAREQGVDVMYAGDGGDELFAGNERYSSQRIFDYYTRLPQGLREWFVKPAVTALADLTGLNLFVLGKKYIRRAGIPLPQRLYSYGLFNVIPMEDLFEGDVIKAVGADYDPYSPMYNHYHRAPAVTELDRQLYIDLKHTISDNDLLKVTRMTQAAGVAVRFPFLDHHLAEFAMSVPARMKMPARELRVFFKRTYADFLPKEILTKTKHGFGLPIPVWLRTDKRLNDMMHELVLGSTTVQRGMFKKKALEELVERHRTESGSFYGDILWNVMIWELWLRTYWDRRPTV
ncbi:asparagine synthase (glutamine-hydrolyzing) [Nitrospira moscoviensis]|uniref:asparagine synthase (glutamine-hydrolyzing) n=1 Tax=Nitrospira moscoviensis TaxID=42253 RepID=A0A0K2GGN6_NITMO|nr:asparagine synthase (glutamine-hydrolyzing) [Nitrospira moscoviensis]ALA59782.1 putative Asparagine synthetase [Nitrospira moscoviensis]